MTQADKMYAEACAYLGVEPKKLEDFLSFYGNEGEGRAFYSLHRITRVIKARKKGHKLDWNDPSVHKYSPWFDLRTDRDDPSGSGFAFFDSGYDLMVTDVGARLVSKEDEHAREIAQGMIDDYRAWMKE